jgi:CO/xanthine dehydrogenase FAD-binding subunit
VKPAPFELLRPGSLEEALAALDAHGDDAKVLAGGQSLVPVLNMRLLRPSVLVDLNRVPELDGVARDDGALRVGALVRQRTLESSPQTPQLVPLVADALPHLGHVVTRNRGTVGGSLAHADPAAELPVCLVALGGSVVAQSSRGRREISADDFFVFHFTTTLEPGELVVETAWPVLGRGWGFAFEEFAQRRGDYGLSIAACALRVADGRVSEARLALGSVVERPRLVETALAGEAVTAGLAREVGTAVAAPLELYPNLHASPEYQRRLTAVLVERAVLRAWRNALEGAA